MSVAVHSDNVPSHPLDTPTLGLPERWLVTLVVCGVLASGVAIRIGIYRSQNSLWADEAAVALNVLDRPYSGLLKRLDHDQYAPVGFLLATKLVCETFGYREQSFWALSFLAGVLFPFQLWWLSRKYCSNMGTIAVVALSSLSPPLIKYSCQLKPYSVDALVTALILALYLPRPQRCCEAQRNIHVSIKNEMMKGLVSIIGVLFSFPSIFVLTGILVWRMVMALRVPRSANVIFSLLIGAVPWIATFGITYALIQSESSKNDYLQTFWESHFLNVSLQPFLLARNLQLLLVAFGPNIGINAYLGALIATCGVLFGLHHRRRDILFCFMTVIALAVVASLMHRWPFNLRLLLFASPISLILLGWAIEAICQAFHLYGRLFVIASVLIGPILETNDLFDTARTPSGIRHVSSILRNEYRERDLVYIYYLATSEVALYRRLGVFPDIPTQVSVDLIREEWQKCESQIDSLNPHSRLWAIFGNVRRYPFDERQAILFELSKRREEIRRDSGNLSLFSPVVR
jgi:hypothetical protein